MVVASTLAFLAVNGKVRLPSVCRALFPSHLIQLEGEDKLNKGQLVELAVENEKRVGEFMFVVYPFLCTDMEYQV
jgi:hypothetical protein